MEGHRAGWVGTVWELIWILRMRILMIWVLGSTTCSPIHGFADPSGQCLIYPRNNMTGTYGIV